MKILLIILFIFTTSVFANDFEDEFNFLEQDIPTSDEVHISSSAIQKPTIKESDTTTEDNTEDEKNIELFFKTEDVKPRRIRSR